MKRGTTQFAWLLLLPYLAAANPQAPAGPLAATESNPVPLVSINASCPSTAYAGVSYSCSLAARDGTAPYSFSLKSGSLPPGLSLEDGRVAGVPGGAVPTTYLFVVTVRDSTKPTAQTADRAYSITVLAGPTLGPVGIGPLVAGVSFSASFTMSSPAVAPLTFSAAGALPPGLAVSSGGLLSGTPTASGTYSFSVTGRDSSSPPLTASRSYSVTILPPPELTPASIASIVQGSMVALTFSLSSPAVAPFQFSVNGNLPAGLTLNSSTGLLSGIATTAGTYSFTVVGRDQSSPPFSANRSFSVTVVAGPDVEPSAVAPMVAGQAVSVQFAMKQPATAPVTFSSSGTIPPGLTLSASTGLLSGVPTTRGSYLMTINARDSSPTPRTASRSYAVTVADAPTLLPAALPPLDAGVTINVPFTISSPAVAPFTISIPNPATLPPGLTLDAARNSLTGAPTTAGEYSFTVQGRDSSSPPITVSRTYNVTVVRQLSLLDSTLPGATVTAPYSATLRAAGGTAPYRFELTSGSIPGLTLSAAGTLSGTPTVASGRASLAVRITDSANPARSRVSEVFLAVNEFPVIVPEKAPAAARGRPYSLSFTVERGTVPGPVVLDSGGLPPGLSFAQGAIFGFPTVTGSYPFTLASVDANGARAVRSVTIEVVPEVSFTTPAALPAGSVGAPYVGAVSATGGVLPYRFALSGGSLPPGMTFGTDGRLAGTPSAEGSFSFAVTVSDSVTPAQTAVRTFTLTVRPILSITTPSPLPDGTQGQFYRAVFSANGGVLPYNWSLASGALPPGLTLAANGELTGVPASFGLFGFSVQVADASRRTARRAYSVVIVRPVADPVVTDLNPDFIQFTAVEGGAPQSRPLQVASSSDNPELYQAAVRYEGTAAGWLTLAETTVAASRLVSGSFRLTADPSRLGPGTYSARVVVNGNGAENLSMVVNLLVARAVRQIVVTPVGLTFRATEAGVSPPEQTVAILNGGVGALNWSATTSVVGGGTNWLSVSPASGTADAGRLPSTLTVRANPSGLPAGDYYGQILVTSPDAINSQTLTVVLTVRTPDAAGDIVVQPTGLLLSGTAPQEVTLTNTGRDPVNFFTGRYSADESIWFSITPSSGTLAPGVATRVSVQALAASAGLRRGTLQLGFSNDASAVVDLVALPTATTGAIEGFVSAQAICVPTQLVPVSTLFGSGFNIPAGWPTPVEVRVLDDCGSPMTDGSIVVSFSNGDSPLSLVHLENGRWSGTWTGRNALTPQVTITVTAESAARLRGVYQTTGGVQANTNPPIVASGGIVNAASYASRTPLAPGTLISIFGARLATAEVKTNSLPLDTTLGVTSVTLGGRLLPLLYAANGQINAMVPYGMALDTQQSLLIRRGTSLSVPEPVVVAAAQPGIFAKDFTGKGQGVVVDSQYRYVEPGNPARTGDVVTIFLTGLGPVSPNVEAGLPAPTVPLAETQIRPVVTIGGQPVAILYSGLAPGFTGLYQLNVRVPAGLAASDRVPVIVEGGGRSSQAVTIAVQP